MIKHRSRLICVAIVAAVVLPQLPPALFAADPAEKKAAPAPDWRALFQLHYATRVQEFRQQNLQFQNVILLGDSITEGFDIAKYFPDRRVLNRGIGADVIGNALPADDKRGVLKRLDE